MKKLFITIILIFSTINLFAFSMDDFPLKEGNFFATPAMGLNMTYPNSQVPDTYSPETQFSYIIGTELGYIFSEHIGIITGVEYTKKSFKHTFNIDYYGTPVDGSAEMRIDGEFYIFNLALRGLYSFFYFDAGLYFGLKTGDWNKTMINKSSSLNVNIVEKLELDEVSNDLGILIGFGALIPVTDLISFDIGTRFGYGFIDIYKFKDAGGSVSIKAINAQIKAGVMFKF
jgi:hypothetical protein